MSKGIRKTARRKPPKPSKDFPLFAHAAGVWAKKVRGKLHYFGPWADHQAALERWLAEKDDLLAGRTPNATPQGSLTVATLCNHYLTHKRNLVETGELADRTFATYYAACERLVKVFGRDRLVDDVAAGDFRHLRQQIAKQWGPVALANEIQRTKSVFKFGYDEGLIEKPIRYGQAFDKPTRQVMRRNRAEHGLRMFEREELLKALDHARVNMRAMLLLGINGGLGNTDLALMPLKAIDLKGGWLNYPRPKTAIPRRIPLWPETVEAIKVALAGRHTPKDASARDLLFVGPRGEDYVGNHRGYRIAQEMKRCLEAAELTRRGLSFYALRHTFQTVAEGARDLAGVQAVMGHAASATDMSATYRERVDDDRLVAVVQHVHDWLFGTEETK